MAHMNTKLVTFTMDHGIVINDLAKVSNSIKMDLNFKATLLMIDVTEPVD